MHGLGDNIYQRAVLRAWAPNRDVYLVASWPQLYSDIPWVHCVRHPNMQLRTQARNARETSRGWHDAPVGAERLRWHYVNRGGSILSSLCDELGFRPAAIDMSGPPVGPPPVPGRYVVVRPATLRREWWAESRNPDPQYLARAAAAARAAGYTVVSIADLVPGQEWAVDPLPPADIVRHAGEFRTSELLALIAGAAGLIGGVGWMVPAALAYRRPMLLIYGGWGVHNGPARVMDPRVDDSHIVQALPDNFCMCGDSRHNCDKRISGIGRHIDDFVSRLSRG